VLSAATGSTEGSVDLSWIVPVEDNGVSSSGAPQTYDIRYSTLSFGSSEFSAMSSRALSNGSAAVGATVNATLTGLNPGATYYFRIKSIDEANNTSAIDLTSPQASARAKETAATAIDGYVRQANGQAINLVFVEALTAAGVISTYTYTDSNGYWRLGGLTPNSLYTVRVSWTVGEITSSVYLENVPTGSGGVVFNLEINIDLATITGSVALAPKAVRAMATAYAAPVASVGAGFIEVYQKGKRVGVIYTDADGRYIVPNLLPGRYALRAYNGLSFSEMTEVTLVEGQVLSLVFKFDLLPEEKVYCYPNPARYQAAIRFESVVQPLEAQALIFDITGALVRELTGSDAVRVGAEVTWNWDLRNTQGEPVASGIYLVHVKVHDPATNRRAGVIKKLAVVK